MTTTNDIGDRGEEIAAAHLADAGYRILERNYRHQRNEVDLVCEDPGAEEFVFVEVKTRSGTGFGVPEASITEEKQRSLRAAARGYLHSEEAEGAPARFDVVAIMLTDGPPRSATTKMPSGPGKGAFTYSGGSYSRGRRSDMRAVKAKYW